MSYLEFVGNIFALLGLWSSPVILFAVVMGIMELAEKASSRKYKHGKGVH